jgi:hypothetical protein
MVVKVSKPQINVREKISELDKPSGLAGQAMLAAETPQEQFNLISAGRRNLIINGGFDVWQRGNSFGSSPGYTADRWWAQSNHTGSAITQEEFAVGQTEVPNNPRYFLRSSLTYRTTAGDRIAWGHKIENWRGLVNQTLTISGWYRRTAIIYGTGMQLVMKQSSSFYDSSGLAGSPATADVFPLTSDWKPFKYTFFVPSSIVGTMSSSASFDIRLYYQTCYGAGNFDIANVQLEYGNTATPFEHRSYGEELALCQRYYQKIDTGGTMGHVSANNYFQTFFRFNAPMRATPSFSIDNPSRITQYNVTDRNISSWDQPQFSNGSTTGVNYLIRRVTGDGLANANSYAWNDISANNSHLRLDAEL